jgi:hypothetical protein
MTCTICGADASLTGWNEEKDLSRFECAGCGAILVYDGEYNETILKGEKRDWEKFLSENLRFPFVAVVTEYQSDDVFAKEKGPIRQGDKVEVHGVAGDDDFHGIIVALKIGRKRYHFPLCDLAAADDQSFNHTLIDNYGSWFANNR